MRPLGEKILRADPENRKLRKELEKEHSFSYKEPLLLTMLGIGLIWNIENQTKKYEERKEKEEQQNEEDEERRRRRRERDIRAGTWDPMREDKAWAGRDRQIGFGERDSSRGSRDTRHSRGYKDAPRSRRPREDRYDDYSQDSRYDARYDDRHDDRYDGRHDKRYEDYYDRYDDRRGRSAPRRRRRDSF